MMEDAQQEAGKAAEAAGSGIMDAGAKTIHGVGGGLVSAPGAAVEGAQNNMFGGAENPFAFFMVGLFAGAQQAIGGLVTGAIDGVSSLLGSAPKVLHHTGNAVAQTLTSPINSGTNESLLGTLSPPLVKHDKNSSLDRLV